VTDVISKYFEMEIISSVVGLLILVWYYFKEKRKIMRRK